MPSAIGPKSDFVAGQARSFCAARLIAVPQNLPLTCPGYLRSRGRVMLPGITRRSPGQLVELGCELSQVSVADLLRARS